MKGQDERIKKEFIKNGIVKALFFLVAVVGDIVFKARNGWHLENIIMLSSILIVSVIIGIVDFKKKHLSINEIVSGYKAQDERVIVNADDAAMKIFVFGYIFIFVYCVYSAFKFSLEGISIEGLLFIVMSAIMGIESKFINKNTVASTYVGNEPPYYENNKKEKQVKKRIIATWSIVTLGWILLDIIDYRDTALETTFNTWHTWVIVIAVEILTTALFAYIDVKLMKYGNRKNIERINDTNQK